MRPASADERRAFSLAVDEWVPNGLEWLEATTGAQLIAQPHRGQTAYSLATQALAARLAALPWPPEHAGLYLGRIGHRYELSLEAARILGQHPASPRARLGAASVQPFLYGRDLQGVRLELRRRPVADGRVLVADDTGEVLGVARITAARAGTWNVQNVADLGWYLREGG